MNLDNFQDMIVGAVRQAIVQYAPEIGISITSTPKPDSSIVSKVSDTSGETNAFPAR